MAFIAKRMRFEELMDRINMPFYIVNEMDDHKVMDVEGADPEPGTQVIIYEKQDGPAMNQLWYFDEDGRIHSKLNDLVLDTESGELRVQFPQPGKPEQQWRYEGQTIINRFNPEMCLDVYHGRDRNGQKIIPYEYEEKDNQQWHLEFIDV